MRFQSSLSAMALVAASFGVAHAAPVRKIVPNGATSFTSKICGFAVWLPAAPAQNEQSFSLPDEKEMVSALELRAKSGSIFYEVDAIFNSPKSSVAKPRDRLDFMQQQAINPTSGKNKLKNKLLKSESLQINEFQGREIKVKLENSPSKIFRARFFFTPKFFYIIYARGTVKQMQNAQIDKVFDSFRILPQ